MDRRPPLEWQPPFVNICVGQLRETHSYRIRLYERSQEGDSARLEVRGERKSSNPTDESGAVRQGELIKRSPLLEFQILEENKHIWGA